MEGVLTPDLNRRVGQAMHTYDMLADGDRVLLAVSGGVDSLVLSWLLMFWQSKAPIFYELQALHIDMDPDGELPGIAARSVQETLECFHIPITIIPAAWQPPSSKSLLLDQNKDVCFNCSKSRRKQLFDFAGVNDCNKIAFGHHQDDIIETFFINLCYGGNISTMVPRQDIFQGSLSLIRPLAFLTKEEIYKIADVLELEPVRTKCPLSEKTKRMDIRNILHELYKKIPEARQHIFASLANVRHDYLLKPVHGKRVGKGE